MPMSARPKAKVRAKVRMEARDGPKAVERIGTKAAADKIMGTAAKDGATRVGEKEMEAKESPDSLKGKVREKARERRACMNLIMRRETIGIGGAQIGHRRIIADRVSIHWPLETAESLHGCVDFVH